MGSLVKTYGCIREPFVVHFDYLMLFSWKSGSYSDNGAYKMLEKINSTHARTLGGKDVAQLFVLMAIMLQSDSGGRKTAQQSEEIIEINIEVQSEVQQKKQKIRESWQLCVWQHIILY